MPGNLPEVTVAGGSRRMRAPGAGGDVAEYAVPSISPRVVWPAATPCSSSARGVPVALGAQTKPAPSPSKSNPLSPCRHFRNRTIPPPSGQCPGADPTDRAQLRNRAHGVGAGRRVRGPRESRARSIERHGGTMQASLTNDRPLTPRTPGSRLETRLWGDHANTLHRTLQS